ncbi:MAG: GntR family transcriptional regulator, partial [Proteobacteria bacterium]
MLAEAWAPLPWRATVLSTKFPDLRRRAAAWLGRWYGAIVPSKTPKPAGGDVETSLTTAVLDRLRADILAGELLPGEKLRLEHLTERYG